MNQVITPNGYLKCWLCGKRFHASPLARYCSYRCTNDAYIERRRERRKQKRQKRCDACGLAFQAKRIDAKHCSSKCRQAAYRLRVTDIGCGKFTATRKRNATKTVARKRKGGAE